MPEHKHTLSIYDKYVLMKGGLIEQLDYDVIIALILKNTPTEFADIYKNIDKLIK